MTTIWTVLAAIIIFCILIFVHELGHFISAKLLGIYVREFAIGMGPALFKKQRGETLYSVRALPIGGFCALEGEDVSSNDPRALSNKPAWAKLIVMAAGSFMNLLLGLLLLFCLYGSLETIVVPEISYVKSESVAEQAGLLPGDEMIKIGTKRVHTANDVRWEVAEQTGSFEMTVLRNGEKKTVHLELPKEGKGGPIGIEMLQKENSLPLTIKTGFHEAKFYVRMIIESVVDLVRGRVSVSSMSGPVGIVSEIGSAVSDTIEHGRQGFLNLLNLAILLSINLGVFNLLPIPALDGGRIFFVLIEMIRRKPLPPEKEGMVHLIGFALLILLSLFIAYQDVLKLF